MAIVDDFVMVRFASRPYSFMQQAHKTLGPWLKLRGINFTSEGRYVYFELPLELQRYSIISSGVCKEIAPFATEIKRRLSALSWMEMRKYRAPLSAYELQNLADAGIVLIL